jgi:hypothetical protein
MRFAAVRLLEPMVPGDAPQQNAHMLLYLIINRAFGILLQ